MNETELLQRLAKFEDDRCSDVPFNRTLVAAELQELLKVPYEDEWILFLLLRNWSTLGDQLIDIRTIYPLLDDERPSVRIAVYKAIRNVVVTKKIEDEYLAKHLAGVCMKLQRVTEPIDCAQEIEALAALIALVPASKDTLLESYAKRRSGLLLRQLVRATEGLNG